MFSRGFKTWCETVALQQRRSLQLRATDPLDPSVLATSIGVEVHSVDEIPGLDADVLHVLRGEGADSWSAVTLADGVKSVIILNSAHSAGRSASNLMHELAHLVIGHRPGRIDITEDGTLMLQTYDRQQEDEANWLAGCLLLPRPALMFIERQGLEANSAARVYGVSTQMLQYRRQVTGVQYQMRRRHASTRE